MADENKKDQSDKLDLQNPKSVQVEEDWFNAQSNESAQVDTAEPISAESVESEAPTVQIEAQPGTELTSPQKQENSPGSDPEPKADISASTESNSPKSDQSNELQEDEFAAADTHIDESTGTDADKVTAETKASAENQQDIWDNEANDSTRITVDDSQFSEADGADTLASLPKVAPQMADPIAAALPELPDADKGSEPSAEEIQLAKQRIELCEHEAIAFGDDERAASLWYEVGRLYEIVLANPRQAGTAYQSAFKNDPAFIPVLQAARRLFSDVGNWSVVEELIVAESKANKDKERASFLQLQRAYILQDKLNKPEEAERAYQQALELNPGLLPALNSLARLYLAAGRWSELATLYSRFFENTSNGKNDWHAMLYAARLQEFKLDSKDEALKLYRQVLEINSSQRDAALGQARLLESTERWIEYAEALILLARIESSERRSSYLVLAARVYHRNLQDRNKARRLLERAKQESPRNLFVLRELADILSAENDYAALADVLLEQAACTTDKAASVALYSELGHIYEDQLNDPQRAIEQFQKVASLDPRDQPSIVSLGRLFFHQGKFKELVELYDSEISAIEDGQQRVGRLFKVAELLQKQIGDIEAAIKRYQDIIEIDPAYLPAIKALNEIFVQGERWLELIALYETELKHTEERDQRIFLLDRIGTIYDEKLDQLDKSIESFERILQDVSNYLPAIRTLANLYTRAQRHQDLIQVLEREAQAIEDPKQVVALKFRTGEIYERMLDDQDKAISIYQQVLSLSPSYLPALKSLGRIYHQREQYEDLIKMNRQEIEVSKDPAQQTTLLYKIGELYAEKLKQPEKAAAAFHEVLDIVPDNHPALRALARLARERDDKQELVKINKQECDVLSVDRERAVARCRAALAEEFELRDDVSALQTYHQAQQDDAELCLANLATVRLCRRSGNSDKAIEALQQISETTAINETRAASLSDLAQISVFQKDDYVAGLSAYEKILASQEQKPEALRGAMSCAVKLHDYPRAIEHGQELVTLLDSAEEIAALYADIARWKSEKCDPPQDAFATYLKLLQYQPAHPMALQAVERRYLQASFHQGLYALKLRALEQSQTGPEQVTLLLQLADLAAGPLSNKEEAVTYLQGALEQDPRSTLVLRRLKELYKELGRTQDQLRIVALEADASPDPKAAVQHLLEIGRLQEEDNQDLASAADCYLMVLNKEPTNNEAFARADRLLGQLQRHADLDKIYHDRVSITDAVQAKVGLLLRSAQLEKDLLKDPAQALKTYQQAIELNPQQVTALIGAGDIALELNNYTEAESLLSRAVQCTQDKAILDPLFERIGDIRSSHLQQADQAIQAYLSALAIRINDPKLLKKIADIYIEKQAWAEASDMLAKRLTFASGNEDKLDALYKLAQIYETGLNNPAQAAQFLEQALAVSPNSLQTVQRLSALYKRTGNWQALAQALERLIKATPHSETDKLVPLYRELAQLHEGPLAQPDKATTFYKMLIDLSPGDRSARYRLATHYAANPSTRTQAIAEFRTLVPQAPAQVEVYRKLHELFAAEGAHDQQYLACAVLDLLQASNDDEAFFFEDNRKRSNKALNHSLNEARHESLLVHPNENALIRQILQVCADQLSKVYPGELDKFGLARGDRLGAKSTSSVRVLMDHLVQGLTDAKHHFDVYLCSDKRLALAIENTDPPGIIVGQDVVRTHKDQEQRFLLGRLAESRISGHFLIQSMTQVELGNFLTHIALAIQPQFSPLAGASVDEDLTRRIGKALSRSSRKALQPLIEDLANLGHEIDLAAHLAAIPLTQVRAGILLSGDLPSSLRLLARELGVKIDPSEHEIFGQQLLSQDLMREVLSFAVSDAYAQARQDLHLSVDA